VLRDNSASVAGLLVVLLLVRPLSAGPKFAEYPVPKASECAAIAQRAGLVIGVQPVEDLNDQKAYFSTQLTPKGFVPVFMVLENGSSGDSFLFDKTAIKLGQARVGDSTPKTSMNKGQVGAIDSGAIASAFFVPLAGAVFAMIAFNNADAVRQNILRKEVQSKTLSPGVSVHGFLYVPVPKKGPRDKIRLQVPVTRSGTNETLVLEVVF
jgi:hypothetical protein